MTDNNKPEPVRDTYNGIEVWRYPDGTLKRVDNANIIRGPDHARITTSEKGKELAQRKKEIERDAKIRAYAKRQGLNPDTLTPEQLLMAAGTTLEEVHDKALELYFDAKTARSAEGLYPRVSTLTSEADRV